MAKDTHLLDSSEMQNYYSYVATSNENRSTGSVSSDDTETVRRDARTPSIVDGLLMEIYDHLHYKRSPSVDSDTFTEYSSSASEVTISEKLWTANSDGNLFNRMRYTRTSLDSKERTDLEEMRNQLRNEIVQWNNALLRQLKRRDRLITKRSQSFDVITAILQAVSPKRSVDTRMKFSIQPFPGDSGFSQWHDAMKMVARLPGGIPPDFRKRLWITLADRHIQMRKIDWRTTKRFCFNERSNPDDDKLGTQIVKDLHRTGCSMFSGDDAEHNQALLKRVLLAYARWNKTVGYCQGFNMLAAIILEVMEWQEEDALKVMLFLIEGVLPESYFANHLRGLSVDMAVFRDLLGLRLCSLSHHLDRLQVEARDSTTGTSYEPPLTNVFTMQWFLTLFSNCLPKSTVLRVWDLIFLEGNEVLLRTALAIWDGLADRITTVESADEFYSIMGVLTREMLEFGLMDANDLVTTICTMAPFPFPQLGDLRDKYTYNIRPFTSSLSTRRTFKLFYSDDEDDDDEHIVMATWCVSNSLPVSRNKADANSRGPSPSSSSAAIFSAISPGAVSPNVGNTLPSPSCSNVNAERMTLDLSALKKQYAKLRERQKQAHVILTGGFQHHMSSRNHPPVAVNHLLIGKKPLVRRNKHPPATTFAMRPMATKQNSPIATRQPAKHLMHQAILPKESGETLSWEQVKKQKKKADSKKTKTGNFDTEREEQDKLSDNDLEVNFISSNNSKKSSSSSSSSSSTSTELCDDDVQELSDYTSSPELHRKFSAQSNKLSNSNRDGASNSESESVGKLPSAEVQLSMPKSSSNLTVTADLQEESHERTNTPEQTSPLCKISLPEIIKQSSDSIPSVKISPDKSEATSSEISPDSTEISPDSSSAESSIKSLSNASENKSSESTDDTTELSPEKETEFKSTEISFKSSFYTDIRKCSEKSSTATLHTDSDSSNLFQQDSGESKEDSSKIIKTPIASSFRERKDQISAQSYSPFPTVRKSSISSSVREAGIRLGIYGTNEKQKIVRDENQKFDTQGLPR